MERKILIVDDCVENIQLLRGILEDKYTLFAAKNGEKAIKISKSKKPDLILLDIMMPKMDGYEVCRILKNDEETRSTPIIFVTAMGETEDEQKGLDLGAVDYITKPVKAPILLSRVRTHIELKEKQDALVNMLKMEKELAKTKEDIERITRHDLKSPLNAVINYPKMIKKMINLPKQQIYQLNRIEESGRKILDMINFSLDLYKMETGTYNFRPVPIEILSIIEDITLDYKNYTMCKNLRFDITINGEQVIADSNNEFFIFGEKLLFYSLLANLIKNALEASPKGEKVNVMLSDEKDCTISIQNQGTVPKEIRMNFFNKYVTSGKEYGTGLGTYSASLITETMGGKISMESSEENGVTVMVSFPKKF